MMHRQNTPARTTVDRACDYRHTFHGCPVNRFARSRSPSVSSPRARGTRWPTCSGLARCAPRPPSLDPRPQVIQFPETALSGYFVEGGVREVACTAGALANDLDDAYRTACAAGRRAHRRRSTSWSASTSGGATRCTTAPRTSPSASMTARRCCAMCIARTSCPRTGCSTRSASSSAAPTSARSRRRGGARRSWCAKTRGTRCPGRIAALDGAQLVFVSSAAPARGLVAARRWRFRARTARRAGNGSCAISPKSTGSIPPSPISSAPKAASGSSARRCWWDRAAMCASRAPVWDESMMIVTLDLDDLVRARADAPLLSDLRVALPHVLENVRRVQDAHARRARRTTARSRPRPTCCAARAASHRRVRRSPRPREADASRRPHRP